MKNRRLSFLSILLALCCVLVLISTVSAHAQTSAPRVSFACVNSSATTTLSGTLDKANYLIEVPSNWNGTLLLYSHGYEFSGNTAQDASDSTTEGTLLQRGYALAGSAYSQDGWALQQAFHDQIGLLNYFDATCGHPNRTIPWGDSLGGMVTAGLVQLYPSRFAGAVPMCGVLSGGIAVWNEVLDEAFAFNQLIAGGSLPIVNITDPSTTFSQAEAILTQAQTTPAGRARLALSAALADLPGWFTTGSAEPAPTDFAAQEQNQFLWQSQVDFAFLFLARAELESRAGGNPSWNTGVDYRTQLHNSVDLAEVQALYKHAGLNLNGDLHTLNSAPRIKADPAAVAYLNKYITFDGDLPIPVLTMHTTGDGLVVNQAEQSYATVAKAAGDSANLRQVFVKSAGHCAFTPAENVIALITLIQRLDTGHWDNLTDPTLMNQEANALGSTLNSAPPAFIHYKPAHFLRPFIDPDPAKK